MITSKRSLADHVGQAMQVGHDVHVGPGLDVGAEELGGVRHPLAVERRAVRNRLQRAELEHAWGGEVGAAGDEAVLEIGARLALGARRPGKRERAAQAFDGVAPAPQLGRGRHRGPTGVLTAFHGGHHARSPLRGTPISKCGPPNARYACLSGPTPWEALPLVAALDASCRPAAGLRPLGIRLGPLESSRLSQRRPASARGRRVAIAGRAVRPRRAALRPDDPLGDQPARRGPDAAGGRADRRRPAALPRLLRQLRARPVLPDRRARLRCSGPRCSPGGSCAWRSTPAWPCSPTRSSAATRPSRSRWAPGWPWPRRWRSRASRTPTRPRWRSASAGCCSPSAAPVLAGALAGVAAVFRLDLGVAALAGVGAARGPASAAAARRADRRLAVALVLLAPVVIAAPGDFWDQTIGFALDEQGLQRLPLPGAWDGGFEPNKILEHYFPYVLLAGDRALAGRGGRAAAAGAPVGARPAGRRRRRLPAGARRRLPPRPARRGAARAAGHRGGARARAGPHRLDGRPGGRARPDRAPRARPQAHPAARPAAAGDGSTSTWPTASRRRRPRLAR